MGRPPPTGGPPVPFHSQASKLLSPWSGGTWLESTAPTTSAPRRGVTRPLQSSIRWENHTFDTFEWFSTNFSLTLTWNCTCTGRATCVESSSRGSRTLTSTWWECTAWPKTTSPHWVADWIRFWAEEEWQLHPAYYWSRIVLIEKILHVVWKHCGV